MRHYDSRSLDVKIPILYISANKQQQSNFSCQLIFVSFFYKAIFYSIYLRIVNLILPSYQPYAFFSVL